MADEITFDCPSCNQSLEAPAEMAGEWTECPECGTRIEVRDPNRTVRLRLASDPGKRNRGKVVGLPGIGDGTAKKSLLRSPVPSGIGCSLPAILLIGLFVFIVWIAHLDSDDSRVYNSKVEHMKDGRITAWIICQDEIEERLFAPGTVEWPPWWEDLGVTYTGNGKYRINSYCDSQNMFGALVRLKFQMVLWMGDDMENVTYRVDSLTFDP